MNTRAIHTLSLLVLGACSGPNYVALTTCPGDNAQTWLTGIETPDGSAPLTLDGLTTNAQSVTIEQYGIVGSDTEFSDLDFTLFKQPPSRWEYRVDGELIDDDDELDSSSNTIKVDWDTTDLPAGTYEHTVEIVSEGSDIVSCSYEIHVEDTLVVTGIRVHPYDIVDEIFSSGLDLFLHINDASTGEHVASASLPDNVSDDNLIETYDIVYSAGSTDTAEPIDFEAFGNGPWTLTVYDDDAASQPDPVGSTGPITTEEMLSSPLRFDPVKRLIFNRGRDGSDEWMIEAI